MDKKVIKGILIVLSLAGLYFLNIQQQKEYENTEIEFLNVEKSLIKKIIISSASDAIELTAIDSSWVISGNDSLIIKPNAVENLLEKLYDIKKEHKVTSKEEKWAVYKVDPPSGTHLAFIGNFTDFIERVRCKYWMGNSISATSIFNDYRIYFICFFI